MRLLMLKNQQRDHRLVWWGLFFLSSWTTTTCHARVFPPFPFPSTGGPIPEVSSCRSEDLEEANDSQLYTILQELTQTNFFRNFVVDLDQKCPLTTPPKTTLSKNNNNNNNYNKNPGASTSTNQPLDEPSKPQLQPPEEGCASEGLPDQDDDAGPACAVQDDVDDPFAGFGGQPFTTSSYDAQPPPTETTTTPPPLEEEEEEDEPNPPPQQPQEEEEEFECNGGEDLDLDDDAEPLCHLTHEDMGYSSSPIQSLISMALQTIQYLGWESESQKDTYLWHQQTDMIVEDDTASDCDDNENDDDVVNDLFWQDMCSHIQAGDGTKVVNLVLNPERNTGYNGTHIWRAIYEENCLAPDKDDQQHHMMCYEERVLYRLLSGLHTSTTLSIAKHYYPPSKRKNRTHWEPNPEYFMTKFDGKVDYIRNLHFSYVVLLRALKKASSFLYHYDIRTGNPVEDETATILLRRLLDSGILKSCQSVFSAFDESLMFQEPKDSVTNQPQSHSLQESFKGVFHNISSILDCVQCQQCKLHGKMAMLGYGTALKILFIKNHHSLLHSLERNEIVAFINTIAKFSESMREIRELTATYWEEQPSSSSSSSSSTTTSSSSTLLPSNGVKEVELVDVAVGLAAKLAKTRHIEPHQEAALVQLAMAKTPELLILAKHYQDDATKFWQFAQAVLSSDDKEMPDAIVVGSGLAGLSAALNLLDRGGRVVVVEKEHLLGGNSNKASSGINACCPHNDTYGDMLQSFYSDTVKSAGDRARPELVEVLVNHSASAVEWLKDRVGVDLSLLAQLGGHSHKRTHRPSNGMAGAEIIYGVQKAVRKYEKTGAATILTDTRVTELVVENDRVVGIRYYKQEGEEEKVQELRAHNIVLATGGFASDRRQDSYLAHYRPELLNMPATAGPFSTGDGIALATSLGAGITDMDKVQLHPTGWVDPADPLNPTKILAAELMRGVGGVLLNDGGQRFCNELGTRAYVTDRMLSHDAHYAATGVWDKSNPILDFALVLSSSAAASGQKHVDLYSHKKLLTRLEGVEALAHWLGLDVETVRDTLTEYRLDASKGVDAWGKTSFRGAPQQDLDAEVFYAGRVTPVLHYCMGGITIDAQGHVLDQESQQAIPGLHAAGEVTGGVHGANRLGGNSLLECTVFGSLVGRRLPIHTTLSLTTAQDKDNDKDASTRIKEKDRTVTRQELEEHNNDGDCWVAIHGVVYDLTEFAEEHPAGPESIRLLAGLDGTEAFQAVHNSGILDDFEDERVGILQDATEGGGGGAIANRTEESCNDTT